MLDRLFIQLLLSKSVDLVENPKREASKVSRKFGNATLKYKKFYSIRLHLGSYVWYDYRIGLTFETNEVFDRDK